MIYNYSCQQFTSSFKIILKSALLALFCIILPFDAFASNPNYDSDVSTNFLSFIFGSVNDIFGGVLSGKTKLAWASDDGSQYAGAFVIFNQVMALVAVVIIVYISLVGLVNSAHSGTALGQRWHSFFLPLRVCVGGALLLPLGVYNMAQVLAMWFILQGVNIANDVWYYTRLVPELFNPQDLPSRPVGQTQQILFYRNLAAFGICIGSAAADGASSGFTTQGAQFRANNSDCGGVSFSFGAGVDQAAAINNYRNFVENVINIVEGARPSYSFNNYLINSLFANNEQYNENSYLEKLRAVTQSALANANTLKISENKVNSFIHSSSNLGYCVNQNYSIYNVGYLTKNIADYRLASQQYSDYYNFYSKYGNALKTSKQYIYDNNIKIVSTYDDTIIFTANSNNISSLFFLVLMPTLTLALLLMLLQHTLIYQILECFLVGG